MILAPVNAPAMCPCPGCGLELPASATASDPRSLASDACRAVYGEVAGFELQHVVALGRWHQLLVDTYAAQHAGASSPPLATAFALIGLHLALEEGWDGIQVRDAHQSLARRYREWPRFERPGGLDAGLTIGDLALAGSPEEHVATLRAWASEVWVAWRPAAGAVREVLAERLPAPSRTGRRR
jgi:hypothetical protein